MSHSINLNKRVRVLALAPALAGAAMLGLVAVTSFGSDASAVGVAAAIGAALLAAGGFAAYTQTTGIVDSALQRTRRRLDALEQAEELAADGRAQIEEFASIDSRLEDLIDRYSAVRAQADAVGAGNYDAPELDVAAPGRVGESLWSAFEAFRRLSHALRDSQTVTTTLMDTVSDGVLVVDADGRIVVSNGVADVALAQFDGSLDHVVPGWREFPVGDHEFTRAMPDGTEALTHVTSARMVTSRGMLALFCWRDMSDERAMQVQVARTARTDSVTGMPNRQGLVALHDRLCDLGRSASAIHIDLDDFAQLNQRHGFLAGDQVLQQIAARLSGVLRHDDTVARVGGDEFILLIQSQNEGIETLARRVLDRVEEPIEIADGTSLRLSARAGWSTGLVDSTYELLRRAAYALTEAADTPGGVCGYNAEVAQRDEHRRQWERELRRALGADEFRLFAQPIVDVLERRVLGVEIFVRWQHPSGRLISPSEFIDIAGTSDIVTDLDRWVIKKCISEAVDADPSIVFSLNVSNRFMAGTEMADLVRTTLAQYGVPAGRIQVDVAETDLASDSKAVTETIMRLNAIGVRVALDDFGTGYASVSHALKMAVSTVKVDRRIVGMVTEPEGRGMIEAVMSFARKRNLDVVAEGVESADEAAELAELGCRFQQGYYHGHPAPLNEVLRSLDSIPFRAPTAGGVDEVVATDGDAFEKVLAGNDALESDTTSRVDTSRSPLRDLLAEPRFAMFADKIGPTADHAESVTTPGQTT